LVPPPLLLLRGRRTLGSGSGVFSSGGSPRALRRSFSCARQARRSLASATRRVLLGRPLVRGPSADWNWPRAAGGRCDMAALRCELVPGEAVMSPAASRRADGVLGCEPEAAVTSSAAPNGCACVRRRLDGEARSGAGEAMAQVEWAKGKVLVNWMQGRGSWPCHARATRQEPPAREDSPRAC
jgi:hypothetical protein